MMKTVAKIDAVSAGVSDDNAIGYIESLTCAIERWSLSRIAANADAFRYRGADFRRAVERRIYFKFVNNDGLISDFASLATKNQTLRSIDLEIFSNRFEHYLGGDAPKAKRQTAHFKDALKKLIGLGRPESRGTSVAEVPVFAGVCPREHVLFVAIQPKFVSFLLPVVERLGPNATFLTLGDELTLRYLEDRHLPGCHLKPRQQAEEFVNSEMVAFQDLCVAYDAVTECIEQSAPSAIVMPEGNAPAYEVVRLAAKEAGIPTICIQHGWSPVLHPGFRGLAFDEMLVWGARFGDLLREENPSQVFTIAGNPNISRIANRRRPDRPVKIIGFFLQKGGPLIAVSDWIGFLELIAWTAAMFPDIAVVVRDHPSSSSLDANERNRIGASANIRFSVPSREPLNDVLRDCDIVVAMYSTTLIEALCVGAVPLIVLPSRLAHYHPDLESAGVGVEAANNFDAKEKVRRLISDDEFRVSLLVAAKEHEAVFFARSGADAIEFITERIAARRLPPVGRCVAR
jgi:hypothetical protein